MDGREDFVERGVLVTTKDAEMIPLGYERSFFSLFALERQRIHRHTAGTGSLVLVWVDTARR